MPPITVRVLFTLVGTALLAPHTRAGLYNSAEKCPIPVRQDAAGGLPFGTRAEGPFPLLFMTLLNVADANPQRTQNPDRAAVLQRVRDWQNRKPREYSDTEHAGHAADLLRLGRSDDALNVLAPLSRARVPDFHVLANLAHVYAVRGEWEEASRWHQAAFLDADFPDPPAGATAEQGKWLRRVEREFYRRWLQVNRERAAAKLRPADEDVFPLLPGVRWVNDAGQYEPGKLAAAERAKLPPDAIPVVQQLLLWSPGDTSLYWLLAELYAADGRVREAAVILDQCADTRQFSNRTVMMAHRSAIRDAVARLPKELAPEEVPLAGPPTPPKPEPTLWEFLPVERLVGVGAVFAVIVGGLVALQVRAVRRRGGR